MCLESSFLVAVFFAVGSIVRVPRSRSRKLINSLVHQPLVVTFVYVFRVKCRGSIQELGGLGTDCLEPVELAADYSIFASCGDFGFWVLNFVKLQSFGLQSHSFVI